MDESYSDIVNLPDKNNDNLAIYLPFSNSFFIRGKARKKFLTSAIFEHCEHNGNGVDRLLKAFNIMLQITNASAFVEVDLEKKEFFFITDTLYNKERMYFIDREDKETFHKHRSFEATYNYVIRDINEIIEPILNTTIKDISELTHQQIELIEIINI